MFHCYKADSEFILLNFGFGVSKGSSKMKRVNFYKSLSSSKRTAESLFSKYPLPLIANASWALRNFIFILGIGIFFSDSEFNEIALLLFISFLSHGIFSSVLPELINRYQPNGIFRLSHVLPSVLLSFCCGIGLLIIFFRDDFRYENVGLLFFFNLFFTVQRLLAILGFWSEIIRLTTALFLIEFILFVLIFLQGYTLNIFCFALLLIYPAMSFWLFYKMECIELGYQVGDWEFFRKSVVAASRNLGNHAFSSFRADFLRIMLVAIDQSLVGQLTILRSLASPVLQFTNTIAQANFSALSQQKLVVISCWRVISIVAVIWGVVFYWFLTEFDPVGFSQTVLVEILGFFMVKVLFICVTAPLVLYFSSRLEFSLLTWTGVISVCPLFAIIFLNVSGFGPTDLATIVRYIAIFDLSSSIIYFAILCLLWFNRNNERT